MQARFKQIPEALIPVYINERVGFFSRATHLTSLEEDFLMHHFPRSPRHSFMDHPMKIQALLSAFTSNNWSQAKEYLNSSLHNHVYRVLDDCAPVAYSPSFKKVNPLKLFSLFKHFI
jgi:hypothetical protein